MTSQIIGTGHFARWLLLCVWASTGHTQEIRVGPNVLVSGGNSDRPHYETILSAHPEDPDKLLGAAMAYHGEENTYKVVPYASFDGGLSWRPTGSFGLDALDPAVAHGADGEAYLAAIRRTVDWKIEMLFYRSDTHGNGWSEPVNVTLMDREYVTVDLSGGRFSGRVYVHGTNGAETIGEGGETPGTSINWSDDGGRRFRGPTTLVSSPGKYVLGMGNGAVLSDGTFIFVFGERLQKDAIVAGEAASVEPNTRLMVAKTDDGGVSFTTSKVADWHMQLGGNTTNIPALAMDSGSGPFKDRLFATWPDSRSGRSEILLAYSTDRGATWSAPVIVNDDMPGTSGDSPDHLMPVVAVNDAGMVGVMWYDRRDSPDNLGWHVRFAVSGDGGETFLPSVPVSEAPFRFDLHKKPIVQATTRGGGHPHQSLKGGSVKTTFRVPHFNNKGGDTAGLAVDAAGVFHPFWIDNRTGTPQVWTARVSVSGRAIPNGSLELQDLQDLSESVAVDFTHVRFDTDSATLSVRMSLRNTSDDSLQLPLTGRLLSLRSPLGTLRLVGTKNRLHASGATLQIGGQGAVLKPGASVRPQALVFRIEQPRAIGEIRPEGAGSYQLASLEMKIFGSRQE